MRALAARRLFRVPPAAKALYIYKHPCLLRDSNPVPTASQYDTTPLVNGHGSRVVKVSDRGWPCHEFEPSTTKDPPSRILSPGSVVRKRDTQPLYHWVSNKVSRTKKGGVVWKLGDGVSSGVIILT
ncbi:hypothetical protein TNCV_4251991 [Trichonephila clavipes]|nr:hypothetical protein TNCV_4251991 [Trichonephila clavipes]